MATKKSSTKAKTKTRKAVASTVRPKATTRAKPITKKSSSTPAARVVVSKDDTTTSKGFVRRLLELHRISAGVFILLAVLAGYFIKNTTVNLTLSYATRDDLASKSSTVFAPAVHGLYDLNIRWVVVAIMIISAVLPLLWYFRWRRQYELNIEAEVMPQRWFDLAITTALMTAVIAQLSGVHDVMTLKLIGGLVVISCLLGWIADKQNRKAEKSDWSAYSIGVLAGVLPWLLIAVIAVTTFMYGIIRMPWYVYALYTSGLVGFILIELAQRRFFAKAHQWKFIVVERNYVLINLFVKATFAIILIAGLHR